MGDVTAADGTSTINWTGVLIGLAALAVVWYIAPKKGRA
jgi:hypothetical protein